MDVGFPTHVGAAENLGTSHEAHRALKKFCYRCHGTTQKIPDFDVLDRHSLTKQRGPDANPFVVPGNLEASGLWEFVGPELAYMPPEGSPEAAEMTDHDRELIGHWIRAGAPFPQQRTLTRRKWVDDLTAVREFLIDQEPGKRRHLRFMSLSHLSNSKVWTSQDLNLIRAGVSKLLNSLSWEPSIVVPATVPGTEDSILVFDLRDLNWTPSDQWLQILSEYPYGVKFNYVRDESLRQAAIDVYELTECELPVIRADWFVVNASRGDLYHDLLRLPKHVRELESMVGVDALQNIRDSVAVRAGFGRSGVSRQNRMVERHESKFGAYWISYDFMPRRGRGDLIRYPLGPRFPGNRFRSHAFDHDGGEAIFHLPNGLQGYFLLTADGDRLDGPAPADVVYDSAAISGSPAIVNGLSCMNCHREGMIRGFRDEIRDSHALSGEPLEFVRKLYVEPERMDRLIDLDRKQFLTALEKATGHFLRVGGDQDQDITEFPEPIGSIAQRYIADLGPEQVAFELGLNSLDEVSDQIRYDRDLRKLGLGTLIQASPGTIKRARWEAIDGTSFFHDVIVELGLGTPVVLGTTGRGN